MMTISINNCLHLIIIFVYLVVYLAGRPSNNKFKQQNFCLKLPNVPNAMPYFIKNSGILLFLDELMLKLG